MYFLLKKIWQFLERGLYISFDMRYIANHCEEANPSPEAPTAGSATDA